MGGAEEDLGQEVEAAGPWITGFETGGRRFGGGYLAEGDPRVRDFVARFPGLRRVIELGCLEGGHTSVLAEAYPEVVAVDGRASNLRRASLLLRVRGRSNVRLVEADVEREQPFFAERFDAVFCVGLLYHLADPAALMRRMAAMAPLVWLWTQVCAEADAVSLPGGLRGRPYAEPDEHPLNGLCATAQFLTRGSLVEVAEAAGFERIGILTHQSTPNGPAHLMLLER